MSTIFNPLTTINSSDTVSASRSTLNTNYTLRHAMTLREIADADDPYTWQLGDDAIVATSTAIPITINLPAVASNKGTTIQIVLAVDTGGGLVLDGNASELIDGATTLTITGTRATVRLLSTGTEWIIIELYP
jgi:hypothetical protein